MRNAMPAIEPLMEFPRKRVPAEVKHELRNLVLTRCRGMSAFDFRETIALLVVDLTDILNDDGEPVQPLEAMEVAL